MRADGTERPAVTSVTRQAVRCPRCSTHHEVDTWAFVDARRQPRQREQVLGGHLHVYECTVCAVRVRLELPFHYVDTAIKLWALYLPAEALSEPAALRAFDTRGRLTAPVSMSGSGMVTEPHVVFSIAELVRYIEFREALQRQRSEADAQRSDD